MSYEWVGDRAGVVTGEAVQLDLRPARVGSRTVAYALDLAFELAVLAGALALGTLLLSGVIADPAAASAVGLVVVLAVFVGYPVASQSLFRGRTLGKAALGLRVVRSDGGPAPFRALLLRELVGFILERPGVTLGVLGLVSSMASARGQRLGDRWAGTLVVRTRVAAAGHPVRAPDMPYWLAGWAATLDLSRLPDPLALAVRDFVSRAAELTPQAQERVGGQLARDLVAAVGPPPPGTPVSSYLVAVVAERRRREQSRHIGVGHPAAAGPARPAPAWPTPDQPAPGWPAPAGSRASAPSGTSPTAADRPETASSGAAPPGFAPPGGPASRGSPPERTAAGAAAPSPPPADGRGPSATPVDAGGFAPPG